MNHFQLEIKFLCVVLRETLTEDDVWLMMCGESTKKSKQQTNSSSSDDGCNSLVNADVWIVDERDAQNELLSLLFFSSSFLYVFIHTATTITSSLLRHSSSRWTDFFPWKRLRVIYKVKQEEHATSKQQIESNSFQECETKPQCKTSSSSVRV